MFWKRNKQEVRTVSENENNLYPILHVMSSLKDYHKEMVQKEVDSLWELNEIETSFGAVVREGEEFQGRLLDFGENFTSIEQVSGEFETVKDTIAQSVTRAQDGVEELRNSSEQVATYFNEMETTFEDLQKAGKVKGRFTHYWSIDGSLEGEEKKAADSLVYYFIGESAQDVFNLQNGNGLSLNKNMLEIYVEGNDEFADVVEQLKYLTMQEYGEGSKE